MCENISGSSSVEELVKLTGDVKQRKQYKNGTVNTMEPKRTKGTKQRKSSQVLTPR